MLAVKSINTQCIVPECRLKIFSKGYCRKHYNQLYRYGHIKDATVFEPNKIDIKGDVAQIHLRNPQGQTRHVALIDAKDAGIAAKYMWKLDADAVVAKSSKGGKHYRITLPRFLLGLKNEKTLVTHTNGDILDCRRANLNLVDRVCLSHTAKIPSTNKSGYKGVCKDHKKWHAYLHVGSKKISGGYHVELKDAVEARKRLEAQYFREDEHGRHRTES